MKFAVLLLFCVVYASATPVKKEGEDPQKGKAIPKGKIDAVDDQVSPEVLAAIRLILEEDNAGDPRPPQQSQQKSQKSDGTQLGPEQKSQDSEGFQLGPQNIVTLRMIKGLYDGLQQKIQQDAKQQQSQGSDAGDDDNDDRGQNDSDGDRNNEQEDEIQSSPVVSTGLIRRISEGIRSQLGQSETQQRRQQIVRAMMLRNANRGGKESDDDKSDKNNGQEQEIQISPAVSMALIRRIYQEIRRQQVQSETQQRRQRIVRAMMLRNAYRGGKESGGDKESGDDNSDRNNGQGQESQGSPAVSMALIRRIYQEIRRLQERSETQERRQSIVRAMMMRNAYRGGKESDDDKSDKNNGQEQEIQISPAVSMALIRRIYQQVRRLQEESETQQRRQRIVRAMMMRNAYRGDKESDGDDSQISPQDYAKIIIPRFIRGYYGENGDKQQEIQINPNRLVGLRYIRDQMRQERENQVRRRMARAIMIRNAYGGDQGSDDGNQEYDGGDQGYDGGVDYVIQDGGNEYKIESDGQITPLRLAGMRYIRDYSDKLRQETESQRRRQHLAKAIMLRNACGGNKQRSPEDNKKKD